MEPIFSLPYSEFCVAQRLAKLLPAAKGYSLYAPISRQQPGVDLVLVRRRARTTRMLCIQVKSSRTYSRPKVTERTRKPLRYRTWFKTFPCPPQADVFCLVTLFPAVDAAQRRELGTWWSPLIILFSRREMRRFLRKVRTVGGREDRMFGFGFDDAKAVFQTRGDSNRRFREFTEHLLENRVGWLRKMLLPRGRLPSALRRGHR